LDDPLADALGDRYGKLEVPLLSRANTVADGTTVLLLRDSAGQSRAVVLCSTPVSPDMVQRAMNRAHQAKVILGASTGATILDPLAEGSVRGLSYAVLPYCNGLSESRLVWWIQRELLRPSIFDWLWRVTECTVCDVEPAAIDRSFAEPLRRIASLEQMNDGLRAAAERAAERLDTGAWTPKHVLMHGDLWKGNILIRKANRAVEQRRWRDRFVIIDWAGSEINGYAMYDLVRLAQSMGLNARSLRSEVDRHCRLLRCEPADATSYLLAALGHILINLEHFPMDRYARVAESCLTTLEHALE
jgi:hypothetical protein